LTKRATFLLLAASALCGLSGCLQLEQPHLDRRLFTIDPERRGRDGAPGAFADQGLSLRVRRFEVSRQFADRLFAYRVGENEFQTDSYNAFVADPADLATERTVAWLNASRLFRQVVPSDLTVRATHLLQGMVVELYGDYANEDEARAVVAVRFLLTDERSSPPEIVLDETIRRSAPIEGEGPEALAAAWSSAFAQALAELEERLRRATPSPA